MDSEDQNLCSPSDGNPHSLSQAILPPAANGGDLEPAAPVFRPETFQYIIEMDPRQAVPVDAGGALIGISFRHFSRTSIDLGGGGRGHLNIGFRLYPESEDTACFEHRAERPPSTLEPSRWLACSLRIPRDRIEFGRRYRLYIDLVREEMYWFRDHGQFGFYFDVEFQDAVESSRGSLQSLQVPMLVERLVGAFARINELEDSERRLIAERDEYRSRCSALSERMGRDIDALAALPPPAATISEMIRSFDAVQRRDHWLGALSTIGLGGAFFALFPHNGAPGPLRILVHGTGGFGDMIYLGIVVRELQEHFGNPEIFVLHSHAHIDAVFGANPRVSAAVSLSHERSCEFLKLANRLDIFDLVAEVRYAVSYSLPPLSRVPSSFQLRAHTSAAEWQKYVRYDWPHMNHLFANAVAARGLGKLDVVGLTSLLPISRRSDVDLFIPASDMVLVGALAGVRYVTVHHGADRNMASSRGVQTKNMTEASWAAVVTALKAQEFSVVQLGEQHEGPIAGVDLDLRGRLSLLQSAYVIKTARAHIDTEGGLVHVARAVNTRCVVLFGPTPAAFFGYPQNDNMSPSVCGNCWWVTQQWAAECVRGFNTPECMASHDPREIATRAAKIARGDSGLALAWPHRFTAPPTAVEALRSAEVPHGEGLIVLGAGQDVIEVAQFVAERYPLATLLIETTHFQAALTALHATLRIKPYSPGNIPLASGAYRWAIGIGLDLADPQGLSLVLDLQRCVGDGGPCYLLVDNGAASVNADNWLADFASAVARHPGGGYLLDAPERSFRGARGKGNVPALLLRLTRTAVKPAAARSRRGSGRGNGRGNGRLHRR